MKRIFILATMCLVLLPVSVLSQTRRRTTRSSGARSTSTQKKIVSADARAGAERVAEQIKILTRFLYVLGGVTKTIEAADEAAGRSQTSPAALQQIENSKASVKASLRNVREGLDKLELDFRLNPNLQRYYTNLAGSAAGAATAEEQAAANRFDQAGRSLLAVVNRLTDVLLEMR